MLLRLGFCLAALILFGFSVPKLFAETLKNPRIVFTGSNPSAVSVGDFNGDGKPDLAYLDGGFPPILHILTGNGDGTFSHGQDIALAQGLGGSITVADVNNDGRLDLLVGGSSPQRQIGTFLGNGDGTFGPIIVSVLPINLFLFSNFNLPFGVADLNGDGAMDLIVSDPSNDAIYTVLGNNTGSFTLQATIFNGGAPGTILTGDFNGDGKPDFLARGILGADATVYLGKGDGTFQAGVSYSGPNHVTGVALADMDGDGHLDMVISGFDNSVSILHGNADGTFATTSSGGITLPGPFASVVAVADFNGDGILDIELVSADGSTICLGQGNLAYVALVPSPTGPTQPPAIPVRADFNLDGHPDLAATVPDGIALLVGNGDGTFQSFDNYAVPGVSGLAVADFSGDHVPDIAAAISLTGVRLLLGDGLGKFSLSPSTIQTLPGSSSMVATDFNGDGATDLLFQNTNSIMFGHGDTTFSPPLDLSLLLPGLAIAGVGDLNHDGRSDLLAFGPFNLTFHALLGQTANTFTDVPITFPVPFRASGPTAFADFNHDGIQDVVIAGFPDLQPMLGNGNGTFRLAPPVPAVLPTVVPTGIFAVAVDDLDGDGNVDIVVPLAFLPTMEIFYGNGDGTFAPPVLLPMSRPATQIVIADMNGDGKPDLVLADAGTTTNPGIIFIIHNNGARSFGPEIHYLAGNVGSMAVKDVNGDGFPDIVLATGPDVVSVLLNQPGNSTLTGVVNVTPEPSAVGQPLSVTLILTPATATGSVIFSIDDRPIANVPVSAGVATFTALDTSAFAVGAHTVTAIYSGDATFTPATFAQPHKIVPVIHPTSISLTASPGTAVVSQTVHLAFTVTSAGPTPTGSVVIRDGAVNIGTVFLDFVNPTGTGVFNTALLGPGTHSLTALYQGDVNSAPSTSAPVFVVVSALSTTTSLAVLPPSPQAGSSFALSATVSSTSGTPSGSVSFFDGSSLLGARELDSSGVAVFPATFSAPGTHSYTATYNGNGPFAASTSAAHNLSPAGPVAASSALQLSVSQDAQENRLLFTAVVQPASGAAGRKVTFFSDNVSLGEGVMNSAGSASLTVAGVFPGTRYFSAVYAGDETLGGSVATMMLGSPLSGSPEFTLLLSAADATLRGDVPALLHVEVDSMNGFNSPLTLSCASAANVTCSFQPASLNAGGKSVLSVALVPTQTSVASFGPGPWTLFFVTMASLVLYSLRFMKTRARQFAGAVLGLACLAMAIGCGGQISTHESAAQVTITATSTQAGVSVSHSTNLRVTIVK